MLEQLKPSDRERVFRTLPVILLGCALFLLTLGARPGILLPFTGQSAGQSVDPDERNFWNNKFKGPNSEFNHQPSRLLVEAIRERKPGRALDLGMGEGRNAIYLAQRGWQVTGVDLSDVGVTQAKKHAAQVGVSLDAVLDGLDHYDFGRNRWDLIILFYMHAWYHEAKPRSPERLFDALKPGGLLVIEGFAGTEKFMFQPNELLRDFGKLRVLRYEEHARRGRLGAGREEPHHPPGCGKG